MMDDSQSSTDSESGSHPRIHRLRSRLAFTLTELLIVVIIIAILIGIAIPVYLNQRKAAWRAALLEDVHNANVAWETASANADGAIDVISSGNGSTLRFVSRSSPDRTLATSTVSEGDRIAVIDSNEKHHNDFWIRNNATGAEKQYDFASPESDADDADAHYVLGMSTRLDSYYSWSSANGTGAWASAVVGYEPTSGSAGRISFEDGNWTRTNDHGGWFVQSTLMMHPMTTVSPVRVEQLQGVYSLSCDAVADWPDPSRPDASWLYTALKFDGVPKVDPPAGWTIEGGGWSLDQNPYSQVCHQGDRVIRGFTAPILPGESLSGFSLAFRQYPTAGGSATSPVSPGGITDSATVDWAYLMRVG